jgi:glycosyltransferase involved in cell wall biosynthesis
VKPISLTYSLADQNFAQTKSLGILNLSVQMAQHLAQRPEIGPFTVLSNHTLDDRLALPAGQAPEYHDEAVAGRLRRMLWDQWGVYRAARRRGHAWLFLPKGFASCLGPCPVRLATCVADGMSDFYRRTYPGVIPPLEDAYFRRCFAATLRYSSVIFTISDFTSTEVARLARALARPAPPIRTIGIGFESPPPRAVEKQDRIVVLAGRWPHKRTDLALDYLVRWQDQVGDKGACDWVGSLPPGVALPARPRWRRHPRLQEEEYRQLVAEARALVYFSQYEGFGMPPLEAVLAGTCPVYSDLPVTRQVMSEAGFAFANEAYDSFAQALNHAIRTTPETLRAWAANLLRRHNWQAVGDRVIQGLAACQSGEAQPGSVGLVWT